MSSLDLDLYCGGQPPGRVWYDFLPALISAVGGDTLVNYRTRAGVVQLSLEKLRRDPKIATAAIEAELRRFYGPTATARVATDHDNSVYTAFEAATQRAQATHERELQQPLLPPRAVATTIEEPKQLPAPKKAGGRERLPGTKGAKVPRRGS